MSELSYNTTSSVIESWERLKRIKNYQEVAGVTVFQRLFEKCPQARVLFGFPIDIDTNSSELLQSKRFLTHAAHMMDMMDAALSMFLGPDMDMLHEIIDELADKHRRYGVTAPMFPILGEGFLLALETHLGESFFDNKMKEAWKEAYSLLSCEMINAMSK
ncbi:hypothetical protein FisN_9Lh047 [Fistulifera solaris]|uniref:Globin domain-containing protein n=1 Tax=Fistulifera solaris TaxID=1519565 RepID=A0A1Z5KL36_FISSO|nr:hypothetical protein FisN_9Lh047 [Fistulifera solaris]|eukprot:GAX26782.1 hypothetical protein FisN_9Lh047 [Fistulifera solaris]